MDFIHVVLLSIIEGITEFLPISSTGHLILGSNILQIPQTEFLKTFMIAIQSGAVLAIVNLYWKKLLGDKKLIYKALLGLIPTSIVGIMFYPLLKSVLLENPLITAYSLIIGGVVIIIIEKRLRKREKHEKIETTDLSKITYRQAFFTGLTQSLAIIPGVSRSASSIFGGMLLGMKRKTATEFSFILALPTILAATGFDLIQTSPQFDRVQTYYLLIGIILSFVVALFTIKWLIKYVSTHNFTIFGWYRIAIGIIFLLLFS